MAATYVLTQANPSPADLHPVVLLYADNRSAESWLIKASKASQAGRALGYIQAALMINNPVGINVDHVTSKDNEIADRISRVKKETNVIPLFHTLMQDFPQLKSCHCFHPSAELVLLVTAALLDKSSIDPLDASRQILSNLDKITT